MNLFYQPDIENESFLHEEESKHAAKVLRLKKNDTIQVINGNGGLFECCITQIHHKKVEFNIIKTQFFEKPNKYRIHIGIAPTKNITRFEWFLEKCIEIGIDEITPLLCQHSERKTLNYKRLNKIIISAVKQSNRYYIPKLNTLTHFTDINKTNSKKYIAHCYNYELPPLNNCFTSPDDVFLLIGPEGDFSKSEIDTAINNNFSEINLSKARLRTETAGIVACTILNLINT